MNLDNVKPPPKRRNWKQIGMILGLIGTAVLVLAPTLFFLLYGPGVPGPIQPVVQAIQASD